MLSEPSTQRMAVSDEWRAWWAEEVKKTKARVALRSSSVKLDPGNSGPSTSAPQSERTEADEDGAKETQTANEIGRKKLSDEEIRDQVLKKEHRDRDQWGGRLPGHGGT
ncbi:hypothetical protein I316_02648 [Kwoniella heveanensis BCC8398]|uniref:Uncharacterized protein n=1 Tax=Kwoniella heveanensis BCC8398 TaxID=1296120 RepID=A0A1B9GX39_9TREE|nr:hypothetical protein I316_02648 [Kwoniella heveanensis BCC8398]